MFETNRSSKPEEMPHTRGERRVRFTPQVSAKVDVYRSLVKNFMVWTFPKRRPARACSGGYQNIPTKQRSPASKPRCAGLPWKGLGLRQLQYQTGIRRGTLTDDTGLPFEFVYAPANKVNVGAYAGPFRGIAHGRNARRGVHGTGVLVSDRIELTDPTVRRSTPMRANTRVSYDLPFGSGSSPATEFVHEKLLDKQPRETLVGVDTRLTGREFFAGLTVGF